MADLTVKILDAAASFDFLTLDEAKKILGIDTADTSEDDTISMLIGINSAIISELCNRTFARERVQETWREVYDGRVFLQHWPVKESDIESVNAAGGDVPANYDGTTGFYEVTPCWELEELSGKLSNVGAHDPESSKWPQSVIVTYTGGFDLPTEAPLPLKWATAMLVREERIRNRQAQVAGIRQISHKESRVSFFDPNALLMKTAGMGSPALQSVNNLLTHYMRFWV